MITYSTKFPINDRYSKDNFVNMVIRWNQGSKHDRFENMVWDG